MRKRLIRLCLVSGLINIQLTTITAVKAADDANKGHVILSISKIQSFCSQLNGKLITWERNPTDNPHYHELYCAFAASPRSSYKTLVITFGGVVGQDLWEEVQYSAIPKNPAEHPIHLSRTQLEAEAGA